MGTLNSHNPRCICDHCAGIDVSVTPGHRPHCPCKSCRDERYRLVAAHAHRVLPSHDSPPPDPWPPVSGPWTPPPPAELTYEPLPTSHCPLATNH